MKRDRMKIFIDEIYSKPPKKSNETNKIIYNHIDEIWSIDLADMIDYNFFKKRFRHIIILIDNFSKCTWGIPLKKKASTKTNKFSKNLSKSKRRPVKIQADRAAEFYNFFLETSKKLNLYINIQDTHIKSRHWHNKSIKLYVIYQ